MTRSGSARLEAKARSIHTTPTLAAVSSVVAPSSLPRGVIAVTSPSPESVSIRRPLPRTSSEVTSTDSGTVLVRMSSYCRWTRPSSPRYQRGGKGTDWVTGVRIVSARATGDDGSARDGPITTMPSAASASATRTLAIRRRIESAIPRIAYDPI